MIFTYLTGDRPTLVADTSVFGRFVLGRLHRLSILSSPFIFHHQLSVGWVDGAAGASVRARLPRFLSAAPIGQPIALEPIALGRSRTGTDRGDTAGLCANVLGSRADNTIIRLLF